MQGEREDVFRMWDRVMTGKSAPFLYKNGADYIRVQSGVIYEYDKPASRIRRHHPDHGASTWLSLIAPVRTEGLLPGEGLILLWLDKEHLVQCQTTAPVIPIS